MIRWNRLLFFSFTPEAKTNGKKINSTLYYEVKTLNEKFNLIFNSALNNQTLVPLDMKILV